MYSILNMSKKHFCEICNYETDRLSNINNHLKSKKHMHNLQNSKNNTYENNKACFFCGKIFKQSCHRSRHEKSCAINNKHDNVKEQNTNYDVLMDEFKKQNEILELLSKKSLANNIILNYIVSNCDDIEKKNT